MCMPMSHNQIKLSLWEISTLFQLQAVYNIIKVSLAAREPGITKVKRILRQSHILIAF